jgi:transcriptional regulator with XRE-family HTH domain
MSTPTIALKLAQRLKKLRIKHGLTQEQTAERADLPIRYYQKLESKSPYAIRITTLEKLAKAFKTTPSKLLDF